MKSRMFAYCAAAALLSILVMPRHAASQDSNTSYKLQVNANYTGAGTVDQKHKVYIVLWDTADFAKGDGGLPVAMQSISSKSGTVTFDGVKTTPAYVSTVYDSTGEWDAQSEPPAGVSMGLYTKGGSVPEPVNLQSGKTTAIDLAFDDHVKR